MDSDPRTRQIGNFRLRLGAILALRDCLRFSFAWIMLWAAAVVGLRAVFRIDPLLLLWGLLGLVAAAAAAVLFAVRNVPTPRSVRAVLDRHGCFGGLLMAAGDTDIGQWSQRIARVELPALRWRSRRQWMLMMMSIGFLAAAMLAPDRYLPTAEPSLQIGGEVQKLTDKIQLLKQEEILPPEKAQVLEKDLGRIRQEAAGKDPAKTMESIDHLEQSFSKAAADAAESAIKQTDMASRAQELAGALDKAQGQMDPKQFGEAMKELAQLAQQAAAESKLLSDSLSEELKDALRLGNLTDAQLRELCKALKACKACQRGKLVKLIKAKLVDAGELCLCDKAGQCDEAALAAVLCQCKNGNQLAEALACENGLPGRGGINRGRGDAAMTWQQPVNKGDAAFKEKVLPPGAVASLKESRLAGISVGDPTAAKPGGGSTGGALGAAQAGGGEARTQTILPEHGKTVQRYFDRDKK
jgi:hypothetical protein